MRFPTSMYGSDAQPDRSARSEVGVTHTVAPGGEARGPARIAVVGAGPAGLYAVTELVESGHPVKIDVLKKPASSHRNGSLIIAMTQHWRMPDRKSMRRINRIVSAMTSRWSAFQLLSPSTLQNRATPARRAQQRRIDAFVSH